MILTQGNLHEQRGNLFAKSAQLHNVEKCLEGGSMHNRAGVRQTSFEVKKARSHIYIYIWPYICLPTSGKSLRLIQMQPTKFVT